MLSVTLTPAEFKEKRSMKLAELVKWSDDLLAISGIQDYCPNGLQVQSDTEVTHIATAVSASMEAIEAAAECGADLLLVHHGYFWKSEARTLTGYRARRIRRLFETGLSLLAYHLPLDLHSQLGNNIQLAKVLGFEKAQPLDSEAPGLLWVGELPQAVSASRLASDIACKLGREPLLLGNPDHEIQRLAWCTGGAQGYFEEAIDAGVDLYLSGEVSEPNLHLANETGVNYLAAGHHATERYGVQALAKEMVAQWGLKHTWIDLDNPV